MAAPGAEPVPDGARLPVRVPRDHRGRTARGRHGPAGRGSAAAELHPRRAPRDEERRLARRRRALPVADRQARADGGRARRRGRVRPRRRGTARHGRGGPGQRQRGVARRTAGDRGPDEGRRAHHGRPGGGHDRAPVGAARLARGHRRPPSRRGTGRRRVRLLRAAFPLGGRVGAAPDRASPDSLGHHFLDHAARGQRDLGGRPGVQLQGHGAAAAARGGPLGGGGARPAACRALAGRDADRQTASR